jgi:hypothetical protein
VLVLGISAFQRYRAHIWRQRLAGKSHHGGFVDTTIKLSGEAARSDELRSLYTVLLGEAGLHGRLRAVERPPAGGTLGPVLEALQIVGGSAGLSGVIVAWIRNRRGSWTVRLTRSDGAQLDIRSEQARTASPDQISALAEQLSRLLDGNDAAASPQAISGRPRDDSGQR